MITRLKKIVNVADINSSYDRGKVVYELYDLNLHKENKDCFVSVKIKIEYEGQECDLVFLSAIIFKKARPYVDFAEEEYDIYKWLGNVGVCSDSDRVSDIINKDLRDLILKTMHSDKEYATLKKFKVI